ncbi:hypothetical protein GCM10009727_85830 [Actinomadura napierensis]|uniref:Transposase n=2 Tax=Actinomadura napierensis TaxID=267854 RepID=A0ABN3AGZ2_9ACTN
MPSVCGGSSRPGTRPASAWKRNAAAAPRRMDRLIMLCSKDSRTWLGPDALDPRAARPPLVGFGGEVQVAGGSGAMRNRDPG